MVLEKGRSFIVIHSVFVEEAQGQNIDEAKPHRCHWSRHTTPPRDAYFLAADIHTFTDLVAPSRVTKSLRRSITIECIEPIDISQTRVSCGQDGSYYKTLPYEVGMTVIGTALEFSLWHKGKKIGCRSVIPEIE
jgi:hypothetical protein